MATDHQLSFYMLVKDSQQYLHDILAKIKPIADEIILLDSGSRDQTETIARAWEAGWHFRPFDNFRNQRSHALSLCRHPYVLFLDDDEIPDDELLDHIQSLKQTGFASEAYAVKREWIVMGKTVRNIFPVECPDYPIRLIKKVIASFSKSTLVHESYSGFQSHEILKGKISHYTFSNQKELTEKLDFYTDLAAQDLSAKGKKFSFYKIVFNPIWAWGKWYLLKGSWKDGRVGLILSNYLFKYTFFKYLKLFPSYQYHKRNKEVNKT
jgi:glycosyltransferase involved in cell wall biosynthesis